ncbi:MAG: RNA polymerase sigma-70 factor [Tannerellaceae bacterium]|jgi:RNA polymerase sigma-70 factor (ECF subfamily)|nr:RNA polymerase sigma-70 factor [Tannerellaceae bacterium]
MNEETFRELYDSYFEKICRYLNYYTHDSYAIEEVVQDVFVRLWDERHSRQIRFIHTYLFNSARNSMLNYLRNEERRTALLSQWAESEIEKQHEHDCVDRDEFALLLHAAVERLPLKCKEIFLMSREMELSYKEIAERQHISEKTVENQMGIALKKIRSYLRAYISSSDFL